MIKLYVINFYCITYIKQQFVKTIFDYVFDYTFYSN